MTLTLVQYPIRAESRDEFLPMLREHWATLNRLGSATDTPAQCYVGAGRDGSPVAFEIFEWNGAEAAEKAHLHPEVSQIWEAMGPLLDHPQGRPSTYDVDPITS